MAGEPQKIIPRATYRLQFTKDFGFGHAADLAPYIAGLGISHVYASPYLKARPGSLHGYDIVDHTALNPELGTPDDFARMVSAFRRHGLGQILDFVPNHMGVGGSDNPWWLDVLEWGQDSEFAGWFDIDWDPDRRYLQGKVLVPFLGDQYGAVLESGALRLKFSPEEGSFAVWAYDSHELPVCPLHYAQILGDRHPDLERLGDAFANVYSARPHLRRRADSLKAELAACFRNNPDVAAAVNASVERYNGTPELFETWSRLDALIAEQNWRAAHFRVAADDINYRRFFNINDLAGIRMELPDLFNHAHALVFELLDDGVLDGIRLDHIDGLLDPRAYCVTLREKAGRPFYLLVEKILAPHEALRPEWGVDGTTGYEFTNLATGLLIDPAGEEPLTRFYESFTGNTTPFADIVRTSKLQIMENEMASELNVLARDAARVARTNPRTADFTNNVLHRALRQIIACFPVYRTYIDGGVPADADRRDIDWAVAHARRVDAALDPSVFDFLHQLMTCDLVARPRSGFGRVAVLRVAMRVQQYSGPVMAKGLEDTAFYRYNRMLALNEVGGHPDQFNVSLAAFHRANADRARRTPHTMLATSTHDTKRGEDTRARLAVLSELAEDWATQVSTWSRLLRAGHSGSSLDAPPDRDDEYVFYQLLLGAWPAALSTGQLPEAAAAAEFCTRIEGAMTKSMREAKRLTTWAAPDMTYEDAVIAFIRHALDVTRTNPFLDSFLTFQARIAPLGIRNSLVQAALKLTVPGVPDFYQGTELWDFSMVDPDNRRPVDYPARQALLAKAAGKSGVRKVGKSSDWDGDKTGALTPERIQDALRDWHDGRIKLLLTHALLRLRAAKPELFLHGSYADLAASGPAASRLCAFTRQHGDDLLVVAASLFPARDSGPNVWTDSAVELLPGTDAKRWRNVLDGSEIQVQGTALGAATLFAHLPVAVLIPLR